MKLLASEARNTTAARDLVGLTDATERDVGGEVLEQLLLAAAGARPTRPGVSTGPGTSVFTLMPRSANSAAQVRPNERTAALLAAYTPNGGDASRAPTSTPTG